MYRDLTFTQESLPSLKPIAKSVLCLNQSTIDHFCQELLSENKDGRQVSTSSHLANMNAYKYRI